MAGNSTLVPKEVHLAQAGLSELPSHWSVVEVGELLSEDRGISVGVMYPGKHDPFGVPLLKVGDLTGSVINPNPEFWITPEKHHEYRRTALEGGELLLTLVGGLGQCAVVPPEMAGWNAARAIAVIRLKEPKDARFVRLCLLSQPLQHLMQVWANTTVQATLNLKEIKQLPLPWPPTEEREAIARILSSLDDKIELNQQMNRTLEAIAWTIFNSWFREENFPDEWRFMPLEDCMDAIIDYRGKTPKKTTFGIPLITAKIVKGGRIDKVQEYIASEDYDTWMRRGIPQCGDVVMTSEAPLGEIAQLNGKKVALAQRLITLRGKPGLLDNTYLKFLMQSEFVQEQLHARATGTTVLGIRQSELRQVTLPIPLFSKQQEKSCSLRTLEDKINTNEEESQTLANIRDTLLPKLLSGKIRIKEAERLVEVVA